MQMNSEEQGKENVMSASTFLEEKRGINCAIFPLCLRAIDRMLYGVLSSTGSIFVSIIVKNIYLVCGPASISMICV